MIGNVFALCLQDNSKSSEMTEVNVLALCLQSGKWMGNTLILKGMIII